MNKGAVIAATTGMIVGGVCGYLGVPFFVALGFSFIMTTTALVLWRK